MDWLMKVFQNIQMMLPVLLMNYFRSREQKWYHVSTVFYSFRERLELRYLFEDEYNEGVLAEDAPVHSCPERPFLVIQYLRITKFSAKEVNLDIIIDTTWLLSGYNLTHVKKLLRKHKKSLQKFLEPTRKPYVIYTDNSLEFGKSCGKKFMESSNFNTSTFQKQLGLLRERVRRTEEGTSAVLLQTGLDEKWWVDSMECCCSLRNMEDLFP